MLHTVFSLSIVSHRHKKFVIALLEDLASLGRSDFEVILTLNLSEDLGVDCTALPFPVLLIYNDSPKRFAENHNAAFAQSHGEYFVVMNPDIRFATDPFDVLLAQLQQYPNSLCAPMIVNEHGTPEDSARNFPTPLLLVRKFLHKAFKLCPVKDFLPRENDISLPDWIAGMFIVVPRQIYQTLGGLDERYRMYYEDVDFCARARLAGYQVMVNGHVKVIHEAQRDSHRNLRYLSWHMRSALRFFTSKPFLKTQLARWLGTSSST